MALNRIDVGPDFAERFATGLSTGLAQLTKQKLGQLIGQPDLGQQGFGVGHQPNRIGGKFAGLGGSNAPLNFNQQLALAKFQQGQQSQQQRTAKSETKDFRESLSEAAKAAKENLVNIERMEQLINTGKLSGPLKTKLLEKIGLEGSEYFNSKESQEFKKLSTDFLRNAKAIFGARVTQGEINRYLQTVPTLNISDEGKRAVIRNMRRYNEAAILRNDAKNAVISANNGTPPHDLESRIEQLVSPQLDQLKREIFGESTEFEELPDPSRYQGRKIRSDTGEVFQSDGSQWQRMS